VLPVRYELDFTFNFFQASRKMQATRNPVLVLVFSHRRMEAHVCIHYLINDAGSASCDATMNGRM
jgi:hypothetical protein